MKNTGRRRRTQTRNAPLLAKVSNEPMTNEEFRELAGGIPAAELEAFLQVAPATLRRYKWGGTVIPGAVAKLMRIRFRNDVSDLLGEDWKGFSFGRDGKLYVPFWRTGFDAPEIKSMFYQIQIIPHYEATIRALEKRVTELERDVLDATQKAAKYRRIILSEAQFGLMFEPIPFRISLDGDGHHEATA